MKSKAILMALAMMTTALAGCTSGTDGVPEVDEDALNELIQDNLQDFINNTTVIVNQDFHYHNNTTYVVDDGDYSTTVVHEYNNTTNVEGSDVHNYNTDNSNTSYSVGGGAMGNGSGGTLYLLDIQFNLGDLMPEWEDQDHRNNTIDVFWTYYDYLTNSDRTELFTIQCSDYYIIGSQSSNDSNSYSYFQSSGNYYEAWENLYNGTIAELLQTMAYSDYYDNQTGESGEHVRMACDEHYGSEGGVDGLLLFEIPIPTGIALKGVYQDSWDNSLEQYVWTTYFSGCNQYGEYGWKETYYPRCPDNAGYENAFSVSFDYETINWYYNNGGWVGGDTDSHLSIFVNNIYPNYEYRLVAYFLTSPVLPLE